jgi:hypothetical protein
MLAVSKGSMVQLAKSILQASAINCAFRPVRVDAVEKVLDMKIMPLIGVFLGAWPHWAAARFCERRP